MHAGEVASVTSDSLWPHGLLPTGSSDCGAYPGKNTGVGFHALLHGLIYWILIAKLWVHIAFFFNLGDKEQVNN